MPPLFNPPPPPSPPMPPLKISLFSGSCPGLNPASTTSAEILFSKSWGLVYGGGGTAGLMGACAKTLNNLGGNVHGTE
ncbi:hypothetical protein K440DRAFT_610185 [Wilcoxina mikolae CBS 423.85]|nr:hypothetical protein K440DRAFT_610185 [Wilcoxina mikolae CBS 423.85]